MREMQVEQKTRCRTEALEVRSALLVQVLLAIIGLLALMHIVAHLAALEWDNTVTRVLVLEFGANEENNIPTFFSTLLLLFSALLLAIISIKKRGTAYVAYWSLLSVSFLLLALDEATSLHEYFIRPFREALGATGLLYYTWVVPAAVFVAVFAACYLRFLGHLPGRTRRLFILAGLLYVGGAMGVELLGGQYFYQYGTKDFSYQLLTAVEETLEMTGIVVFIYGLLDYLRQLPGSLQLQIEGKVISLSTR